MKSFSYDEGKKGCCIFLSLQWRGAIIDDSILSKENYSNFSLTQIRRFRYIYIHHLFRSYAKVTSCQCQRLSQDCIINKGSLLGSLPHYFPTERDGDWSWFSTLFIVHLVSSFNYYILCFSPKLHFSLRYILGVPSFIWRLLSLVVSSLVMHLVEVGVNFFCIVVICSEFIGPANVNSCCVNLFKGKSTLY